MPTTQKQLSRYAISSPPPLLSTKDPQVVRQLKSLASDAHNTETIVKVCYIQPPLLSTKDPQVVSRDLASNLSTRLFRWAIVIFDWQKNDHDGFVYRRAKWKLVKYSTYICTSFYKNGKSKPVSSINWIKYHLLNDDYTQDIIRRP